MGDRTYQQATIWQCPEDLARAAAEVLAGYRNNHVDTSTVLGIDDVYYVEEGPFGTAEETAAALAALSQAIVAETWEDPKHDRHGYHHVVLGGEVISASYAAGDPYRFLVPEVDDILSDDGLSIEGRAARILDLAQSASRGTENREHQAVLSPVGAGI
ncbi:MAG: hypothetical protein ACYCST_10040 [Acidimicrobiales bacterium]